MEDQQIIELYWARSQDAIAETEIKYGAYCRTIARNVLAQEQDAEECVNDTWLRAWNAIPPQRPAVLSAFLGKLTRNLALDRFRHDLGDVEEAYREVLHRLTGNVLRSNEEEA